MEPLYRGTRVDVFAAGEVRAAYYADAGRNAEEIRFSGPVAAFELGPIGVIAPTFAVSTLQLQAPKVSAGFQATLPIPFTVGTLEIDTNRKLRGSAGLLVPIPLQLSAARETWLTVSAGMQCEAGERNLGPYLSVGVAHF
jgi:hypothetical protein